MNDPSSSGEIVFQSRQQAACAKSRLVLESVGIPARMVQQGGWWLLVVDADVQTAAVTELNLYQDENKDSQRPVAPAVKIFAGALMGVCVYTFTVTLLTIPAWTDGFPLPWVSIGRMQAGEVMDGQWWRAVTALTLHSDSVHLLSNLAFGSVFGLLAGRILGGGVAWAAIIAGGALGNFMNAMIRDAEHRSIGASTAVFAALGIMVAHALHPRWPSSRPLLQRWRPLIGGVLLLALIGLGGERTDVVAHATGFVAGVMIGWLACRIPERWLSSSHFQLSAGLASFLMVTLAWGIAILSAH